MEVWQLICAVIIFSGGCVSSSRTKPLNTHLNFGLAESILLHLKTQSEVSHRLGPPSDKEVGSTGDELWNYREFATGFQRLTVTFDKGKKLKSVLWIPGPDELESHAHGLLARYPNVKMIPIETRQIAPPHSLDTETTFSDGKSMLFLQVDHSKRVHFIAWSVGVDERNPSADANSIKLPKKVEF